MAFLSGADQEIYAHRLRRSASIDRHLRPRTRSISTSASSSQVPNSDTSPAGTLNRTRLPSTTSTVSSGHSWNSTRPPNVVRTAPLPSLSGASRPNTTATHSASESLTATPFPPATSSHDASRRVHHAASFSDLGNGRPHLATLLKTSQAVSNSLPQSFSTSSSLSSPLHTPADSMSGSLSEPSSRPRLRLAPADARTRQPISPSRGGNISDGGASSDRSHNAASHLDVKRLLSKPAAPSRASVYSVTSDSDSPAAEILRSHSPASLSSHTLIASAPWLGFSGAPRYPSPARQLSPGGPISSSQSSPADKSHTRNDVSPARSASVVASPALQQTPLITAAKTTVTTSSPSADRSGEKEKDRPRVLRKRSRGKGDSTARPFALSSPSSNLPSNSSASRRPATADGRITPSPVPTPKLTPAAALVQAYKEQDVRRERLAATARGDLSSPDSPAHSSNHSSPKTEDNPQAYYTVFGATGTIAADSAEERRWNVSPLPPSISASTSAPARRSLVRKVSGRFMRHKATSSFAAGFHELPAIPSVKSRSSSSHQSEARKSMGSAEPRRSAGSAEPRKSLQERRSMSLPKERRKSLRLSLDDDFVDVADFGDKKVSLDRRVDSGTVSDGSPQNLTGGRLWRLVKRISGTGLNTKYASQSRGEISTPSSPPPPVPAIPKGLLPMPAHLTQVDSPSTPKGGQPQTQASPALAEPRGRKPSTSGISKPNPASGRRSTTTRSSSPSSFFRPPSPRSSASSIAEDVPPLPTVIAKPTTRRFASDESYNTSPSNESGAGTSRRPPPSPDMPVFSIAESVNNFVKRRPSLSQNTPSLPEVKVHSLDLGFSSPVTPAPPRPARSPHRPSTAGPSPTAVTSPSRAASPSTAKPLPAMRLEESQPSSPELAESESGHSIVTVSTARPRTSTGTRPSTSAPMRMAFREIGSSISAARSAQEKDRMWDDLLERSELAGGTLHLGGAGLMSDTLRFSTISSNSSLSTHS